MASQAKSIMVDAVVQAVQTPSAFDTCFEDDDTLVYAVGGNSLCFHSLS